jgi:hypothetical protein
MKIKNLLTLGTMTAAMFGLNAVAVEVDFIEGAETDPIQIRFSSDWAIAAPIPFSPESAQFQGNVNANLGSGSVTYSLLEGPGAQVASDILNVVWKPNPLNGSTDFTINFTSDTSEQGLPVLGTAVVEDGTLQTFTVIQGNANGTPSVVVGMQSDVESVPEGGSTVLMLGLVLAGMGWKRLR